MQPEITQAVSNITISKTYIDYENPDSRVVTASENYIVSPVRDRTTSFYAYLRPLQLSGKAVWFSRQAVGRQKQAGVVGPCTNRQNVFPLQIEKRKSKNDSLSDFSFFNSKTKMNYKVVSRLLYTY